MRIIRVFEDYGIDAGQSPDLISPPDERNSDINDEVDEKKIFQGSWGLITTIEVLTSTPESGAERGAAST